MSDWLIFFSGGIILGVLVLVENPLLSYPLIILSTFGLVILLTALYTVIWVLIMKRENSFERWSELTWWILGGFTSAIVQIALVDLIRFLVTGTWSGFLDY